MSDSSSPPPPPPPPGGLDGSPDLDRVLSQEGRQSSLLSSGSSWVSRDCSRVGVRPLFPDWSLGLVVVALGQVPVSGFDSLGCSSGGGSGGGGGGIGAVGGAGILNPSSVAPPPPAAPRSLRLPVRDCVPKGGVGYAMVNPCIVFVPLQWESEVLCMVPPSVP